MSLLLLAACGLKNQNEINSKYLACYALDQTAKKECLQDVQFEAEKLGFKEFISTHKLPCESIEDGPDYVEDKQAYLVICKPKGQYLMRFDYETKEWQLVKESNG